MEDFITLHRIENKGPIYIRPSHISLIKEGSEDCPGTLLIVDGVTTNVQESLEEVRRLASRQSLID